MSKAIKILSFILIFYMSNVNAQDMHFTQFYSSPLYLNPAFTGADVCGRVSLTYRNQWPGVSKTYRSYLFSADHFIQKYKLGVGLLLGNDIAGTGELKTTIINPSIAYQVKLGRKAVVRAGFQPGIGLVSIDYNKLIFGDQIARGGNVPTIENPTQTKLFFDVGVGALIYSEKYWLGTSVFHLNTPDQSLTGNEEGRLPVKYTIHGGAKFPFNKKEGEAEETKKETMTAVFHYRGQSEFDQFDLGLYYTRYVFNLGLWYRGIPGFKAYKKGYSNNDALAIVTGLKTKRMNIGYSYDITISKLALLTNGAHEITIAYQLCKPNKKKKYGLLIPCPKF
ncbi:MAG: hypothetical protein A3F72_17890 [Bacteroidetes bacterium RIFCSPLOWO2_12_FULL_35_15]|nr:MAG: hypothetical protein A3F72_17890 [Bacteroidetes bacterium RIFCSPLOWO2_12_FULL_35_15]